MIAAAGIKALFSVLVLNLSTENDKGLIAFHFCESKQILKSQITGVEKILRNAVIFNIKHKFVIKSSMIQVLLLITLNLKIVLV